MPKKPSKKDEEEKAKIGEFLKELDVLQQKYDKAIAVYIEYTESGIVPKFKIVPYPKENAKA